MFGASTGGHNFLGGLAPGVTTFFGGGLGSGREGIVKDVSFRDFWKFEFFCFDFVDYCVLFVEFLFF